MARPAAVSIWRPRSRSGETLIGGEVRAFSVGDPNPVPVKIFAAYPDNLARDFLPIPGNGEVNFRLDAPAELVAYVDGVEQDRQAFEPIRTETPLPEGSSSSRVLSVDELDEDYRFAHDGRNVWNGEVIRLTTALQTGVRMSVDLHGFMQIGFVSATLAQLRIQPYLQIGAGLDSQMDAQGNRRAGWRAPNGTFYPQRNIPLTADRNTYNRGAGNKFLFQIPIGEWSRTINIPFEDFGYYPAGIPCIIYFELLDNRGQRLVNDDTQAVDPFIGAVAVSLTQPNPRLAIPDAQAAYQQTLDGIRSATVAERARAQADAAQSREERIASQRARADAQAIADAATAAWNRARTAIIDTELSIANLPQFSEVNLGAAIAGHYLVFDSEGTGFTTTSVAPGAPAELTDLTDTPSAVVADAVLVGTSAGSHVYKAFDFGELGDLPDMVDGEGNVLAGRSFVVGATDKSIALGPKPQEQIRNVWQMDDANFGSYRDHLGALVSVGTDFRLTLVGRGALAQDPTLRGDTGPRGPRGDGIRLIFMQASARPGTPAGRGNAIPAGWYQDPDSAPGRSGVYWWAEAFQQNGQWSLWSDPKRLTGQTGDSVRFIFTRNNAAPVIPGNVVYPAIPAGWFGAPPAGNDDLYFSLAIRPAGGAWAAYTTPRRMTGAPGRPGVDGNPGQHGDDFRMVFVRSAADPGRPTGVAPAPNVPGSQHTWFGNPDNTAGNGPLWMSVATRRGNNEAWSVWSSGIRLTGEEGAQGDHGDHTFFRFRRSTAKPAQPAGSGDDGTPANWSADPAAAAAPADDNDAPWWVIVSTRTDGVWADWTDPVQFSGPDGPQGAAGDTTRFIWRRGDGLAAPAGNGGDAVPADWSDTPDAPAGDDPLHFSISRRINGAWEDWRAPVQIEGDDGEDGAAGAANNAVPYSILKQRVLPNRDVSAIAMGSVAETIIELQWSVESDGAGLGLSVATGAGRPEFDNVHADEATWLEVNGRVGLLLEQSGAGTIRLYQERRTKVADAVVAETFNESEHPVAAYANETYFYLPLTATQIRALTQNTYPIKAAFKPAAAPAHGNGRFGVPARPHANDLVSYQRVRRAAPEIPRPAAADNGKVIEVVDGAYALGDKAAGGGGGNDARLPVIAGENADEGKTLKVRNNAYALEQEPDIPDEIPAPLRDKRLFYEVLAQRDQDGNPTAVPIIAYADQQLLQDIRVVHSFDDIEPTAEGKMYHLTAHSRGYEPGLYIVDLDPSIVVNEIKVKGVVNPLAATQKGALNNPINTFGTIRPEDEPGFGGIIVDDSASNKYFALWLDSAIAQAMVYFRFTLGAAQLGLSLNRGAVDGNIVNLGHTYREYEQAVAALPAVLQTWFDDPTKELTIQVFRSVNNAAGAALGFKNPLRVRRYINQQHAIGLHENLRANRGLELAKIGADFGVVPDYKNRAAAMADDVRDRAFQMFALLDQDARSTALDLRITRPGYAGLGGQKGRVNDRGRAKVRTIPWGNGRGQYWTASFAQTTRILFGNVKEQRKLNAQNILDYITFGNKGGDPGREAFIEVGIKSANYNENQIAVQLLNLRNAADDGNRNPLQFQLPRRSGDAAGLGPGSPRVRIYRYYLTPAQASAAELNLTRWAFEGGTPDFRLTETTLGGVVVNINADEVQFTEGADYVEPAGAIAAIDLPVLGIQRPNVTTINLPSFDLAMRTGLFPPQIEFGHRIFRHQITAAEASTLARVDLSFGSEVYNAAAGLRVHAGALLQRTGGGRPAENLYLWDGYNRNRNANALRHRMCHMHWEGELNAGEYLNIFDMTSLESGSGNIRSWGAGQVARIQIISPKFVA